MFCPTIGKECVGEPCRDWDKEKRQCFVQQKGIPELFQEFLIQYQQDMKSFTDMLAATVENDKFSRVWDRLNLNRILADPATPPNVKQVIEQAFAAPSSDIAEKLLKDVGLID